MRTRRVIGMAMMAALLAASLQAQTKAPAAAEAAPVLNELEQARVQVVNLLDLLRKALLEADQCRATLADPRNSTNTQQVTNALQLLKADIERNHPGYTWDATSGAFTKKPEEKPAAKTPPK